MQMTRYLVGSFDPMEEIAVAIERESLKEQTRKHGGA